MKINTNKITFKYLKWLHDWGDSYIGQTEKPVLFLEFYMGIDLFTIRYYTISIKEISTNFIAFSCNNIFLYIFWICR